jgi:hypothetical protein
MSHLATKRKAEGQHPVASYQMPTPSQGDIIHIDDDEDIDNAPEDVNELYCQLRTTIVGIQYYDGKPLWRCLGSSLTHIHSICRHGWSGRRSYPATRTEQQV